MNVNETCTEGYKKGEGWRERERMRELDRDVERERGREGDRGERTVESDSFLKWIESAPF